MSRYFAEIDAYKYEPFGEVDMVSPPAEWEELLSREFRKLSKGGFEIHRQEFFCTFVRVIGGQRGKVAEFLLRKKDSQGKMVATNKQIATETGASLGTVNALLQELDKADCIKRRTAALMLNPGVAHRGNRVREAYLLELYNNFENSANK